MEEAEAVAQLFQLRADALRSACRSSAVPPRAVASAAGRRADAGIETTGGGGCGKWRCGRRRPASAAARERRRHAPRCPRAAKDDADDQEQHSPRRDRGVGTKLAHDIGHADSDSADPGGDGPAGEKRAFLTSAVIGHPPLPCGDAASRLVLRAFGKRCTGSPSAVPPLARTLRVAAALRLAGPPARSRRSRPRRCPCRAWVPSLPACGVALAALPSQGVSSGTSVPSIRLTVSPRSTAALHRGVVLRPPAVEVLQAGQPARAAPTHSARSAAPAPAPRPPRTGRSARAASRPSDPRSNPCRSGPSAHWCRRPGIRPLPS